MATNNSSDYSPTQYSVQVGGTNGTLVNIANGTTGQILTATTSSNPSWSDPASSVTSIAGTANQITASASTGAVTLSTPSTFIAPGSIAATTSVTATSGNVIVTAGNLTLPATTSSSLGGLTIAGTSFLHAYGATADNNTFVGQSAGNFTLTSGTATYTTGIGQLCLNGLTTGQYNTACGAQSMHVATTSVQNTCLGMQAGYNITTGSGSNVICGFQSAFNLLTGANNVLLGAAAGNAYTGAESNNILIGSNVIGIAAESNVLRIGLATGTSTGNINKAIICGVTGIVVTGAAAIISSGNQLGVLASSKKFKNDIQDMADESSSIYKLRPVTFVWNKESSPGLKDATDERQFGVIAEEAAEVLPSLVNFDADGNPFSFKYSELPALLLNEIQKLRKELNELKERL